MKVAICQVDGKWPNLALMKLSAWHKTQGDSVDWFGPLQGPDEHAALLSRVHLGKSGQIHFAWDNPNDEEMVVRGINLLSQHMPLRRITFYVLIGFNTTPGEDLYRVETLRRLGVKPFVMPYDRKDLYQRRFARYVNRRQIFMAASWQEYLGRLRP